MKKKFVVGIGGVAQAGKDTLCELLRRELYLEYGLKTERIAFADPLKEQCRDIIMKNHNVDIFNCSLDDKNRVRFELVDFARRKRDETNGTFFTRLAEDVIETLDTDIVIVSDVRFCEYPEDEHYYIKYVKDGLLIHLSKYEFVENEGVKFMKFVLPINSTEAFNDPRLKGESDIRIQWEHGDKSPYLIKYLSSQIYNKYKIK